MMMDVWTFLWLLVCLTILISILESIHRRIKERQLMQQELDIQRELQAQQYHVYTLQPLATPLQNSTRICSLPTPQQQQYIHEQQELKACNDLPPRYEDVVKNSSVSITINSSATSNGTTGDSQPPPSTAARPDRF